MVKKKSNKVASKRDSFQTPYYGTALILPYLVQHSNIWEPAAGLGFMARAMADNGFNVFATDIASAKYPKWDFLGDMKSEEWIRSVNYIITNPPFSKKIAFYYRCMKYWNLYRIPFALLIPADYAGWLIDAVRVDGCQKLIPNRRIDYITPTGKTAEGGHTSQFHSLWLVQGLNIPDAAGHAILPTEVYVELSLEEKLRIHG